MSDRFRTRVTGGVQGFLTSRIDIDGTTQAIDAGVADRRDLESTIDAMVDRLDALESPESSSVPRVVRYMHGEVANGNPSVFASNGLTIDGVTTTDISIGLIEPIDSDYIVMVQNHRQGSNRVYYSQTRTRDSFNIRARNLNDSSVTHTSGFLEFGIIVIVPD